MVCVNGHTCSFRVGALPVVAPLPVSPRHQTRPQGRAIARRPPTLPATSGVCARGSRAFYSSPRRGKVFADASRPASTLWPFLHIESAYTAARAWGEPHWADGPLTLVVSSPLSFRTLWLLCPVPLIKVTDDASQRWFRGLHTLDSEPSGKAPSCSRTLRLRERVKRDPSAAKQFVPPVPLWDPRLRDTLSHPRPQVRFWLSTLPLAHPHLPCTLTLQPPSWLGRTSKYVTTSTFFLDEAVPAEREETLGNTVHQDRSHDDLESAGDHQDEQAHQPTDAMSLSGVHPARESSDFYSPLSLV